MHAKKLPILRLKLLLNQQQMEYKTFWSSLFGSFQQVGQNISTRKWHCLFVKKGFEWDLSFTKFPHWSLEWKSLKRKGVEIVLDDKILHRCIMFIMPRHCKGWDKCKGFWESDNLSQDLHMCTTVHCTMPLIWLCTTAQLHNCTVYTAHAWLVQLHWNSGLSIYLPLERLVSDLAKAIWTN